MQRGWFHNKKYFYFSGNPRWILEGDPLIADGIVNYFAVYFHTQPGPLL